jgi:hypothetical protein
LIRVVVSVDGHKVRKSGHVAGSGGHYPRCQSEGAEWTEHGKHDTRSVATAWTNQQREVTATQLMVEAIEGWRIRMKNHKPRTQRAVGNMIRRRAHWPATMIDQERGFTLPERKSHPPTRDTPPRLPHCPRARMLIHHPQTQPHANQCVGHRVHTWGPKASRGIDGTQRKQRGSR